MLADAVVRAPVGLTARGRRRHTDNRCLPTQSCADWLHSIARDEATASASASL